MDSLPTGWLHELEMGDSNSIHQCQMDSADESVLADLSFKCFSPEVYSLYSTNSLNTENPHIETSLSAISELAKTHNIENDIYLGQSSGSPSTPSQQFNGNLNHTGMAKDDETVSQEYLNLSSLSSQSSEENVIKPESCKTTKRVCSTIREPFHARNHILAERKRRERLNQRLISLSSLIPGLKKMDKVTIIEEATKYIKQLKEHVQILEKEAEKKPVEPSTSTVITVQKCRPSCCDDYTFLSADNLNENLKQLCPNIEVRVSKKNLLLRIHCEKSDGLAAKILSEMRALQLNVISSSTLSFGETIVDITIIAQMNDESRMIKEKDFVKKLRLTVLKLM